MYRSPRGGPSLQQPASSGDGPDRLRGAFAGEPLDPSRLEQRPGADSRGSARGFAFPDSPGEDGRRPDRKRRPSGEGGERGQPAGGVGPGRRGRAQQREVDDAPRRRGREPRDRDPLHGADQQEPADHHRHPAEQHQQVPVGAPPGQPRGGEAGGESNRDADPDGEGDCGRDRQDDRERDRRRSESDRRADRDGDRRDGEDGRDAGGDEQHQSQGGNPRRNGRQEEVGIQSFEVGVGQPGTPPGHPRRRGGRDDPEDAEGNRLAGSHVPADPVDTPAEGGGDREDPENQSSPGHPTTFPTVENPLAACDFRAASEPGAPHPE